MIEILQGISGSGKSTYANLKKKEGWYVISRDELRYKLLDFYDIELKDYFEQGMDNKIEDYITEIEHKLLAEHCTKHHNLVIDNTCLKKKYIDEYVNIFNDCGIDPSEVKIIKFNVPYEVCLDRVRKRDEKPIQESVLKSQYDKFNSIGLTKKDFLTEDKKWKTTREKKKWYFVDFDIDEEVSESARMYRTNRKNAIICDLDGTLAHRMVLENPIHMRNFYEAEECDTDYIDHVVRTILQNLETDYKIIFVTGRFERYLSKTMKWLFKHDFYNYEIFSRKDGDTRSDAIVKYEIYRDKIAPNYNVLCIFDDRKRVCAMWEELGIKVLNCGSLNSDF